MNVKMTREQAKRMAKLANLMDKTRAENYNQNKWAEGLYEIQEKQGIRAIGRIINECGTEACVLGQATNLFPEVAIECQLDANGEPEPAGSCIFLDEGKWKPISPDFDDFDEQNERFGNKALQDFFGITKEQGRILFGGVNADEMLTPKQKAAQIRQVIKENFKG